MKVKELDWEQTSKRILNEGTKSERITETWIARTMFGTFTVYSAVGGGFYYKHISYQGVKDMFGAGHRGSIVAKSPPKCRSIQDGKAICQKILEQIIQKHLTKINGYLECEK